LTIPGALALETPIAVRPLPPHLEIHEGLGRNPNVHFFETTADLLRLLERLPEWRPSNNPKRGDGERAANDIRRLIEKGIREANYATISRRFRSLHTIYGAAHVLNLKPPPPPPEAAALRAGDFTARVFRRLFRVRFVYSISRLTFNAARSVLGRQPPAKPGRK
jgi:hypothetical protein